MYYKALQGSEQQSIFKCIQAFTMTNIMALSSLWKMLYLPTFMLTIDGTIGCVLSDIWCQMMWHLIADADTTPTKCCDVLTNCETCMPFFPLHGV